MLAALDVTDILLDIWLVYHFGPKKIKTTDVADSDFSIRAFSEIHQQHLQGLP